MHVAHLTLLLDGREVRKFILNRGVTTIGRGQDNDIVINNLALSRRHANVELKGGRYEVVDLQSQNGVFVNSERIRQPRELQDRDAITLGRNPRGKGVRACISRSPIPASGSPSSSKRGSSKPSVRQMDPRRAGLAEPVWDFPFHIILLRIITDQ